MPTKQKTPCDNPDCPIRMDGAAEHVDGACHYNGVMFDVPAKVTRESLARLATVTLAIESSDISPDEHFDLAADRAWVRDQVARGNEWAWCDATVTVEYDGLTGRDTLGACSYESEADFRKHCLPDMESLALDDLWSQLEARTPAGRANALAAGSRQAITTSYRFSNGARVIARCEAKKISVPWDDALDRAANHAAAALQLMDELGWSESNDLVMGGTRDGYVFVQVPKRGAATMSDSVGTPSSFDPEGLDLKR